MSELKLRLQIPSRRDMQDAESEWRLAFDDVEVAVGGEIGEFVDALAGEGPVNF